MKITISWLNNELKTRTSKLRISKISFEILTLCILNFDMTCFLSNFRLILPYIGKNFQKIRNSIFLMGDQRPPPVKGTVGDPLVHSDVHQMYLRVVTS